jgi:hypothetical protein
LCRLIFHQGGNLHKIHIQACLVMGGYPVQLPKGEECLGRLFGIPDVKKEKKLF